MALHEIPADGYKHLSSPDCPCRPKARKRRASSGVLRTAYVHVAGAPKSAQLAELAPVDDDQAAETECGHVIVIDENSGEEQHHQIPDDGVPHAPTSECGCGPQRDTAGAHVVYVHADPDGDADAALWHEFDNQDGGNQ